VKLFEHVITRLAWRASQVAQVALVAVMVLIMLNIISRQIWRSIPGTSETVEILGAIIMAGGLAYCQLVKGHISIGVLVQKFNKFWQCLVDSFTSLLAFIATSLLSWQVMMYAGRMLERGYSTGHLGIPLAPFIYLVGAGLLVLALVLVIDFLKAMRAFKASKSKGSESS